MPHFQLRDEVRHRPLPAQMRAAVGLSRRLNRSPLPDVVRAIATSRVGGVLAARLGPAAIATATLPDGGQVKVPLADAGLRNLWLGAPYEDDVFAFARAALRAGDAVIDIGAHVGVHTMRFAALVGPRGMVHAFEPSEVSATLLERSIALNGWEARVILHRTALSDAPGGLDRYVRRLGATAQATPITRLDDVRALAERPIRLVKIDVEGAEAAVLEGGCQLFSRNPPEHVIIEVSSAADADPAVDFLLARGYRPTRAVGSRLVAVPLGPMPAVSSASPHDEAFSYRNVGFSHLPGTARQCRAESLMYSTAGCRQR